jgi:hypothetical protein
MQPAARREIMERFNEQQQRSTGCGCNSHKPKLTATARGGGQRGESVKSRVMRYITRRCPIHNRSSTT